MKSALLAVLSFASVAATACPDFRGEYYQRSCPVAGRAFAKLIIRQVDCAAIGFQSIRYATDGKILSYGDVRWSPVGVGKLLSKEDARNLFWVERFYDNDSLYTYQSSTSRTSEDSRYTSVEIIDQLRDQNLYIVDEVLGAGSTWLHARNCQTRVRNH